MKFDSEDLDIYCQKVAPLAGAWIEIQAAHTANKDIAVAPLAGAWIEISLSAR